MKLPSFLDFAFLLKALPPQEPADGTPVVLEHEDFRLTLLVPAAPGMPFRPLGYLLLIFIGSEAVRRRTRVIGSRLPKLCKSLGAPDLAGKPGLVEEQLVRLAQTSVKVEVTRKKTAQTVTFPLFSQLILDFQEPKAGRKWQVRLSGDFYRILKHTAPNRKDLERSAERRPDAESPGEDQTRSRGRAA